MTLVKLVGQVVRFAGWLVIIEIDSIITNFWTIAWCKQKWASVIHVFRGNRIRAIYIRREAKVSQSKRGLIVSANRHLIRLSRAKNSE